MFELFEPHSFYRLKRFKKNPLAGEPNITVGLAEPFTHGPCERRGHRHFQSLVKRVDGRVAVHIRLFKKLTGAEGRKWKRRGYKQGA